MRKFVSTAIVASAIAMNLVVSEVGNAASFTLTVTGNKGTELILDMEGVENDEGTGINVFDVSSVTRWNSNVLIDEWSDVNVGIYRNFINYNVLGGATSFEIYEGAIDNVFDDFVFGIWGSMKFAFKDIDLFQTDPYINAWITRGGQRATPIYWGGTESITTAELIENKSVPEPSLLLGSLLAVVAGAKTLKRDNQK